MDNKRKLMERYKNIFDNSPVGLITIGLKGNIIDANKTLLEILGSPSVDATRKINMLTFKPIIDAGISDDIKKCFKIKKKLVAERDYLSVWGKQIFLKYYLMPIFNNAEKVIGMQGIVEDISKEKQYEKELNKSKDEYKSLFNHIPVGFYRNALDGKIILCNDTYAKIWGKNKATEMYELNLDKKCKERKYPRKVFKKMIEKDGKVIKFETKWLDVNGNYIWTLENARVIKDSFGNSVYYEGMIEDVTSRKNAEEELEKSKTRYKTLFENVPVGIYRTTPKGQISMANSYMIRLFGFNSFEELKKISLTQWTTKHNYPRDKFKSLIEKYDEVNNFISSWQLDNGETVWVKENAKSIKNDNGEIIYYEGIIENISRIKTAENKLIESYQHLGFVNRQVELLANLNKYINAEDKSVVYSMIINSIHGLCKSKVAVLLKFNKNQHVKVSSSIGEKDIKNMYKIEKYHCDETDFLNHLIKNKSIYRGIFTDKDKSTYNFIYENNLKFYIILPLINGKNLVGCILLCFESIVDPTLQELEFYEVFASQSANLLGNTEE